MRGKCIFYLFLLTCDTTSADSTGTAFLFFEEALKVSQSRILSNVNPVRPSIKGTVHWWVINSLLKSSSSNWIPLYIILNRQ